MENSLVQSIENLNVFHLKIIYDIEKDLLIYDRKLEKGSGPPIYGLEVCKAMGLDKEFISLARSVQLEVTGSDKNFLSDKQSNYNSDIVMDKCQVCFKNSEHTHHIKEQNTAEVKLTESEDGISPGQACVFYNNAQFGYKVLGGGWIKE